MSTQTELADAIAAVDQAAQDLAQKFQRLEETHRAVRQAASRAALASGSSTQPLDDSLSFQRLCKELAQRMTGLGLTAVVGNAAIARHAASEPDRSDRFVARWTARIQQLVP
jgi:phage tail tape-measure protein